MMLSARVLIGGSPLVPTRCILPSLLLGSHAVCRTEAGQSAIHLRRLSKQDTVACSSSSSGIPTSRTSEQSASTAGIVDALRGCQALVGIGALAAWSYLSVGMLGSPFASISALHVHHKGAELVARSAWTGLATGVLHTLCGPDHLAGLAPLSIGRGRVAACALGALWGLGHSTGQLILGLVFVLLKDKFQALVPALDKWSAYVVPITLISIGLAGLYESNFAQHKAHEHEQDVEPSLAFAGAVPVAAGSKKGKRAGLATYLTGVMHGLQPDALYVVVPALALPTKLAAVTFIFCFVVGTCAAMGGYTLLIGTTSKALIKEQPWMQSHLSTLACGFSIICGFLMLLSGMGFSVPLIS